MKEYYTVINIHNCNKLLETSHLKDYIENLDKAVLQLEIASMCH